MLNYTDEQIRNIIIDILNTQDFKLKPVGNHHLKRHLVYEINISCGKKYIFKLYYMDRRRSREIASLRVLEESAVKCPRIFRYGDLEDGSEWLITEYIEGETLDLVSTNISEANKIKIFEEIGEELGKLHSFKSFDFFGEWDENGQSVHNITDFYNYFIDSTETAIRRVVNQDLPHGIMLKRAIDKIRSNYALFNNPFISKLLHNDFDGRNILVKQYDGEYKLS